MGRTLQEVIRALPKARQKKINARYKALTAEVARSDEALFDRAVAEGGGAAAVAVAVALGIRPDDLD